MSTGWLQNPVVAAATSGGLGILFTLVVQKILRKRGVFSFRVVHNRVAMSADDQVFGSVRVTWNENPVANLFASAVDITNESLRDYEDVVVRIFSNDTILLTERTEIVGTTRPVGLAEEYAKVVAVPAGTEATQEQINLYASRRDYLVPVFNRGQVVRLSYLHSPRGEAPPTIWVDILHKGVKVRFRAPQNEFLGVPQPRAALVGAIVGLVVVVAAVVSLHSTGLIAGLAFVLGLVAQLPGALVIRIWRKIRSSVGD